MPSLANGQMVSYSGSFSAVPSIYEAAIFSVTAAQGPKSLQFLPYSAISGSNTLPLNFTPVPEPSTWALMLLGFGGLGVARRRARRKTALAA